MKQPSLFLSAIASLLFAACATDYTPVETFTEADDQNIA